MKKFDLLICSSLLFLFGIVFVISCQKNNDKKENSDITLTQESIPKVLSGAIVGNLKLPDGTTTEVVNNGSTVKFTFPKGVFLVGKVEGTEETRLLPGGSYTCTGSCTKGCDVIYAGGSFGCSSCDPSSVVCTGKSKDLAGIESRGFINLDAGISFITDMKQTKGLFTGPALKELMAIPQVAEQMKAFSRKIYGTENPDFSNPSLFKEVAVNMFGSLVTYMIPASVNARAANIPPDDELIDAVSFSCSCDSPAGSSGCTKDSGLGYKKCVSGACVSCTMTVN